MRALDSASPSEECPRNRGLVHVPLILGDIVRRWIGKFDDARLEALAELKEEIEAKNKKEKSSA